MTTENSEKEYLRCFAQIDLGAIDHNLTSLQARLHPGVKTMAVVKANAYGHGGARVARHVQDRVDYFAVACLEEALVLRQAGVEKPILILSYTSPKCYDALIDGKITAAIYNEEEASLLSAAALAKGKQVKLHVVVDTGMGRIGFAPTKESADAVARISRLPGVDLEGIFSHYACADSADSKDADEQTQVFDSFLEMLESIGVKIPIRHLCNSAGTMVFQKQYDMCRLGIVLYGLYPSEEVEKTVQLMPAMKVVSHVIHVKSVEAGTKIGYGHIYTAPTRQRIATVSMGYADGYNRCFTDVGYVLIRGQKAPVVGKVCMDQMMVDVTHIPDVSLEDEAVILGKSGQEEISAETLGSMSHSFNYEVVCNFMPRVHRVYVEK